MFPSSPNHCGLPPCPPSKGDWSCLLQSCSLVLLLCKRYPKVGILSAFVPRHHLNNNATSTAVWRSWCSSAHTLVWKISRKKLVNYLPAQFVSHEQSSSCCPRSAPDPVLFSLHQGPQWPDGGLELITFLPRSPKCWFISMVIYCHFRICLSMW